ncbi:MAG: ComEA family DNA-binding protein [Gammaproteobacteria bacterium]
MKRSSMSRGLASAALALSLGVAGLGLSSPAFAAPVNVNKAGAEEIAEALNGVGIKTARAIVEFREKNGPFKSVDQLADVKGVGDKTVEKIRANVRLQ